MEMAQMGMAPLPFFWEYCILKGQNGLAQSTAVVIDFSCRLTEGKKGSFGHLFIPFLFIFHLPHKESGQTVIDP